MTTRVRPYRGHKDRWEVDIRFEWPDQTEYRERIKAPVSSLSGARRWGEARERELLSKGKPVPPPVKEPAPTLEAFIDRYISDYCEANDEKPSGPPEKRQTMNAYLVPVMGSKRLDEIDDVVVARLQGGMLRAGLSRKTVNNTLVLLNTALKAALKWKLIDKLPCTITLLPVAKMEAEFYEQAEYQRLVDAAFKLEGRKHVYVLLCGDAGLRRGEAMALRWDNVDFVRNVIRVAESETRGKVTLPKSGKSRSVPMTKRLAAALKAHRHLVGPRVLYGDVVDGEVKALTPKTVKCWVIACERTAGLATTGRVHILRHTYCSHLAMAGVPVTAIQALAGHANLTTTMRYMHLSPGSKDDAMAMLEASRPKSGGFGEMLEKAKTATSGSGISLS